MGHHLGRESKHILVGIGKLRAILCHFQKKLRCGSRKFWNLSIFNPFQLDGKKNAKKMEIFLKKIKSAKISKLIMGCKNKRLLVDRPPNVFFN